MLESIRSGPTVGAAVPDIEKGGGSFAKVPAIVTQVTVKSEVALQRDGIR